MREILFCIYDVKYLLIFMFSEFDPDAYSEPESSRGYS